MTAVPQGPSSSGKVERLGRYELLTELARNPHGPLWLARQVEGNEAGRVVLVRRISTRPPMDQAVVERIAKLAHSVVGRSDSRLVPVAEAIQLRTELAVVSIYPEGEPLRSVLRSARARRSPLEPKVAVTVALGVLDALQQQRNGAEGLADLTEPGFAGVGADNALITSAGRVMLIEPWLSSDLGTVEAFAQHPDHLAYRSPDHHKHQLGMSDDLFVIAVLLWELIAGRPLRTMPAEASQAYRNFFRGAGTSKPSELPSVRKVMDLPTPRLDAPQFKALKVSSALADVVSKATSAALSSRYGSIDELRGALTDAIEGVPVADQEVAAALDKLVRATLESRRARLAGAPASSQSGRPPPVSSRTPSAPDAFAPRNALASQPLGERSSEPGAVAPVSRRPGQVRAPMATAPLSDEDLLPVSDAEARPAGKVAAPPVAPALERLSPPPKEPPKVAKPSTAADDDVVAVTFEDDDASASAFTSPAKAAFNPFLSSPPVASAATPFLESPPADPERTTVRPIMPIDPKALESAVVEASPPSPRSSEPGMQPPAEEKETGAAADLSATAEYPEKRPPLEPTPADAAPASRKPSPLEEHDEAPASRPSRRSVDPPAPLEFPQESKETELVAEAAVSSRRGHTAESSAAATHEAGFDDDLMAMQARGRKRKMMIGAAVAAVVVLGLVVVLLSRSSTDTASAPPPAPEPTATERPVVAAPVLEEKPAAPVAAEQEPVVKEPEPPPAVASAEEPAPAPPLPGTGTAASKQPAAPKATTAPKTPKRGTPPPKKYTPSSI